MKDIKRTIFFKWEGFEWEYFAKKIDMELIKYKNMTNPRASYEENEHGCKVVLWFQ